MTDTIDKPAPAAKRQRRMAREPQPSHVEAANVGTGSASDPAAEPKKTKASLVLNLLSRTEGATLDQMVAATGWLPHTTRAALTGLKKKGHTIERRKVDGKTTYFRA
ncbi:DUF3489 domain-containing protein [Tsuneonella sp. HG094]